MEALKIRFQIIKTSIIYTFQNETAYWSNNIASLFSTLSYNIAYIVFINVLFSNTETIAGYTYNEVMLFYFFTELLAYLNGLLILPNVGELIVMINNGGLDNLLTKPLPQLFYVSFRNINLVAFLRDAVTPLALLVFLIDWSAFDFQLINLVVAIIIFILGFITTYCIILLSAFPAFWLGESSSIFGFVNEFWFAAGTTIPYEGIKKALGRLTVIFVPALLAAGISVAVLLNKIDMWIWLLVGVVVTIFAIFLRNYFWRISIRNYTSASS